MRFSIRTRRHTPSVIIVSLIDVLLVVLIFMMVTTTTKKPEPALKLSLPQSKEAKPGAPDVKPFVQAYDRLHEVALGLKESAELISACAKELR